MQDQKDTGTICFHLAYLLARTDSDGAKPIFINFAPWLPVVLRVVV